MEGLKSTIARLEHEKAERQSRAQQYEVLARRAGLPVAQDGSEFANTRSAATQRREELEGDRASAQNALREEERAWEGATERCSAPAK